MTRTRDVQELSRCLCRDGLVIMPTDTLPGFHARLDAASAVARIRALKGRGPQSPLLMLADRIETVLAWTKPLQTDRIAYLHRCWPGPFTCILPAAEVVPATVTAGLRTVAFRVPGNQALRSLLARVGVPLVSTSINCSGEPALTSLTAAAQAFGDAVDLVAEMNWGPAEAEAVPSALLDLNGWPPLILRQGPVNAPSVL